MHLPISCIWTEDPFFFESSIGLIAREVTCAPYCGVLHIQYKWIALYLCTVEWKRRAYGLCSENCASWSAYCTHVLRVLRHMVLFESMRRFNHVWRLTSPKLSSVNGGSRNVIMPSFTTWHMRGKSVIHVWHNGTISQQRATFRNMIMCKGHSWHETTRRSR